MVLNVGLLKKTHILKKRKKEREEQMRLIETHLNFTSKVITYA